MSSLVPRELSHCPVLAPPQGAERCHCLEPAHLPRAEPCPSPVPVHPLRAEPCLFLVPAHPLRPVPCLFPVPAHPPRPVPCLFLVQAHPLRPVPCPSLVPVRLLLAVLFPFLTVVHPPQQELFHCRTMVPRLRAARSRCLAAAQVAAKAWATSSGAAAAGDPLQPKMPGTPAWAISSAVAVVVLLRPRRVLARRATPPRFPTSSVTRVVATRKNPSPQRLFTATIRS